MSPLQLFHTVRWLKPRQIVGQVRYRAGRLLPLLAAKPSPVEGSAPSVRWHPDTARLGVGIRMHDASRLRSGVLRFLNEDVTIGFPPDWAAGIESKLWRYNLHYHEYLWSLSPDDARTVVLDWIERYPFAPGKDGWDPYPISLRLQTWCGYFLGRHRDFTEADGRFKESLIRSMAEQADLLERTIEYRLMGNHLTENAAALAVVGCCLDGADARRQLALGVDILREQLPEQILGDGGHFERSPMYHARITYLLQQLAACGDEDLTNLVEPFLEEMLPALAVVTHPDGEIALFNDAALGIAPVPANLGTEPAASGNFSLGETGYFGARNERGDAVICDAGPIGPDYIPGHAHGDVFSFELTLARSRVVVDSGVFGYEVDPMRSYCRSTRAHNTVEVDGIDQCEFWGAFRVARRAHVSDVHFEEAPDGFTLEGRHDGYSRLPGKPIHERKFRWFDDGILVVEDRIQSQKEYPISSRLHLHPNCEVGPILDNRVRIAYPGGEFVIVWEGEGELAEEESWYCPEFGIRIRNTALAFRSTSRGPIRFCIAPDDSRVTFAV